jgi:hypothetical protein
MGIRWSRVARIWSTRLGSAPPWWPSARAGSAQSRGFHRCRHLVRGVAGHANSLLAERSQPPLNVKCLIASGAEQHKNWPPSQNIAGAGADVATRGKSADMCLISGPRAPMLIWARCVAWAALSTKNRAGAPHRWVRRPAPRRPRLVEQGRAPSLSWTTIPQDNRGARPAHEVVMIGVPRWM